MSTSTPEPLVCIVAVEFHDRQIAISLSDGRVLALPLMWPPRLENRQPAAPSIGAATDR